MNVILIPGLWLDASAWDEVVDALSSRGHHVVAMSLPGQGDGNGSVALGDQLAAVTSTIDSREDPWIVVGHSAGCKLGWLAVDRRVERVAKFISVGGFPGGDGEPYFPDIEPHDGWVTFPGWATFEGPDSADLDEAMRERLQSMFHPVAAGVTSEVMNFSDPRRFDVPVTVICPEFSPAEAREWMAAGYLPDVVKVTHLDFVDLDSGHWPMVSCPTRFIDALTECVESGGSS